MTSARPVQQEDDFVVRLIRIGHDLTDEDANDALLQPHVGRWRVPDRWQILTKWHEQIGDPTVADGILDRLVHNAHRLELRGGSMRKRRSQAAR